MSIELNLCPFCGSSAEIYAAEPIYNDETGEKFPQSHYVRCTVCPADMGQDMCSFTPEAAAELWNKRV